MAMARYWRHYRSFGEHEWHLGPFNRSDYWHNVTWSPTRRDLYRSNTSYTGSVTRRLHFANWIRWYLHFHVACLAGQKLVASTIGNDQQNWNLQIQKRVKNTSAVLGSIKATKIAGLSKALAQNLQQHRELELFVSRAFFKGIMWLNGLGMLVRVSTYP